MSYMEPRFARLAEMKSCSAITGHPPRKCLFLCLVKAKQIRKIGQVLSLLVIGQDGIDGRTRSFGQLGPCWHPAVWPLKRRAHLAGKRAWLYDHRRGCHPS